MISVTFAKLLADIKYRAIIIWIQNYIILKQIWYMSISFRFFPGFSAIVPTATTECSGMSGTYQPSTTVCVCVIYLQQHLHTNSNIYKAIWIGNNNLIVSAIKRFNTYNIYGTASRQFGALWSINHQAPVNYSTICILLSIHTN